MKIGHFCHALWMCFISLIHCYVTKSFALYNVCENNIKGCRSLYFKSLSVFSNHISNLSEQEILKSFKRKPYTSGGKTHTHTHKILQQSGNFTRVPPCKVFSRVDALYVSVVDSRLYNIFLWYKFLVITREEIQDFFFIYIIILEFIHCNIGQRCFKILPLG
jgi:hypothetical protein